MAFERGPAVAVDPAGEAALGAKSSFSAAKLDILASQRDEFHLMLGGFCALGKLLSQSLAVRAGAEAG